MKQRYNYYSLVPKDPVENLRWRKDTLAQAADSASVRDDLRVMCSRDILFFINAFGWTHDPRPNDFGISVVPFITYEYQDEALIKIAQVLGREDVCCAKSRDMGASWLFLIAIYHDFYRSYYVSHLLVSRTEAYVDKADDPKALFWKLDFFHAQLPSWLRPSVKRTHLNLTNLDNGATIDGTATTDDIGRGDRRKSILLDEYAAFDLNQGYLALAASQSATYCRLYNSTYQGTHGAFYDASLLDIPQLRFKWTRHAVKTRGLYTAVANQLRILDHDFWHELTVGEMRERYPLVGRKMKGDDADLAIGRYPWRLDGWERSPWFDCEEIRTPIPAILAQEVMMEPQGSGAPAFDAQVIAELESTEASDPVATGTFVYDTESAEPIEFFEADEGDMRLWLPFDMNGDPPRGYYVLGADISEGTGYSETAFVIGDRSTGEKVCEYTNRLIDKIDAAIYCAALCRWFQSPEEVPAFCIWEDNGPGQQFGRRFMELRTGGGVYLRETKRSIRGRNKTLTPGWWSDKNTKRHLLYDYFAAIKNRNFLNRSKRALRQLYKYQYAKDGVSLTYPHSGESILAGVAGEGHGDIATADALCWQGMKEMVKRDPKESYKIPDSCYAKRRDQRRKKRELAKQF